MTTQLRAQYTHRRRHFKATWEGGAYVDLRFGDYATFGETPTEVINVWDYETDSPSVPFTQPALAMVLRQWVADMDTEAREWAREHDEPIDDWYGAYLENARF